MVKVSSGDGATVLACPGCDVAGNLYHRKSEDQADSDEAYRCGRCGETFDEPVEREPKGDQVGGSYAAYEETLLEMDPDDLPTAGGAT